MIVSTDERAQTQSFVRSLHAIVNASKSLMPYLPMKCDISISSDVVFCCILLSMKMDLIREKCRILMHVSDIYFLYLLISLSFSPCVLCVLDSFRPSLNDGALSLPSHQVSLVFCVRSFRFKVHFVCTTTEPPPAA